MKHLKLIVDNTNKLKAIEVTVNGDDYGTYTPEAYTELRLQLSTGDFHTHLATAVYVDNYDDVIDLDILLEQAE